MGCNTCFVLLVAATPLVPAKDAWVVGAQHPSVVHADFPQGRQPLVELIDTLKSIQDTGELMPCMFRQHAGWVG